MPYKDPERQRQAQREHYQRNKRQYISRSARWRAIRRRELRDLVWTLKSEIPCTDCEKCFHPVAMDFDHCNGEKIEQVARLVNEVASERRIRDEIAKCELVCANCHRVRSFERAQHQYFSPVLPP